MDEPALPPFLMPRSLQKAEGAAPAPPAPVSSAPASAAPASSTLPGTALFSNSAARTAAKAEQPATLPPAPPAPATPAPNGDATLTLETPLALPTPSLTVGALSEPGALATGSPSLTVGALSEPGALATGAAGAATAGEAAPPIPSLTVGALSEEGGAPTEPGASATGAAEAATQPPGPPISIRGRSDGLVVEIGKGSWSEILAALDDRLQQSASFFRNARVALDVGGRAVTEAELTPLLALLKTHGLVLGSVRTSTERTFQAALALGLTATLETAEGTPVADAAPAGTNTATGAYFVYRGYLRSGHRLQRQESILVIGDVNPGAEVSSEGDVLVWGRLRGIAHAGSKGNHRAIVAALDLEPTQLRIADVMTIGPDPRPGQPGKWFWRRSAHKRPEIARLVNDAIALEEWDAARPGGLVSLRRGG